MTEVTDTNIGTVDLDQLQIEDDTPSNGGPSDDTLQIDPDLPAEKPLVASTGLDKINNTVESKTLEAPVPEKIRNALVDSTAIPTPQKTVVVQTDSGTQPVKKTRKRRSRTVKTDEKVDQTKMVRFNKGKVDLTQLSWLGQELESRVFMYGEIKYDRDNWKKGKDTVEETIQGCLESLERHLADFKRGIRFDKESKLPVMAHIVWNANRINDFMAFGITHKKDKKDLYHQPLQEDFKLPPVPQLETFYEEYGFVPMRYKGTDKDPTNKK